METTTISPLERAARALGENLRVEVFTWADADPTAEISGIEEAARAVLQAIREPSEEMLESFGIHKARMRGNYQAMIDAALAEQPPRRIPER